MRKCIMHGAIFLGDLAETLACLKKYDVLFGCLLQQN